MATDTCELYIRVLNLREKVIWLTHKYICPLAPNQCSNWDSISTGAIKQKAAEMAALIGAEASDEIAQAAADLDATVAKISAALSK